MANHPVERSPQLYARIGGALYLVNIILGIFSEAFVRGRLIVLGDAAATAANIRSAESLWRFGIAAEFVALICALGNAEYLKAFTPEQLYGLTSIAIRAHSQGFGASLLILGCCFLIHGAPDLPVRLSAQGAGRSRTFG